MLEDDGQFELQTYFQIDRLAESGASFEKVPEIAKKSMLRTATANGQVILN